VRSPNPATLLLVAAGAVLIGAISASGVAETSAAQGQAPSELRDPASFNGIADPATRSVALFNEAGKVISSPRCMNCHPATRRPTQGDAMRPHEPPMFAGEGHGMPGLPCSTCHGPTNVETRAAGIASIPGDPHWALAPASMSWQGRSLGQICAQIKDRKRNGNRSLAAIADHMAEDHLVGWAWHPGAGRRPAPGTQQQFGAIVRAWIDTGAHCPKG